MASAAPPSTPPRQGPSPSILSSPVVRVPKFYDEHKRDEFQAFGYDVNIHEPVKFTQDQFIKYLSIDRHAFAISSFKFTLSDFIDVANVMAKEMRKKRKHPFLCITSTFLAYVDLVFANEPLLVFKDTGNKPPRGHVTDSQCKPDITAAFDKHWQDDATLWPCVRLAGEKASAGKSKDEQKKQAISYLHYLLLARPDLHVAQGMLISNDGVWFLLGIGGVGVRCLSVTWKSSNLPKAMYAFIYRLYKLAHFADPSYTDVKLNMKKNSVEYTVRISPSPTNRIDCTGFFPLFASSPFGTRTHVLTNPSSEVKVNGQALTVIKDQLCRLDTRYDEQSILNGIHQPVKVPGVVQAVHSETIKTPLSSGRQKDRLGLRQSGSPFMSITTVGEMLETLFDVLEGNFRIYWQVSTWLISLQVLRFLRFERKVLHRDISKGNILYIPQPSSVLPSVYSSLAVGLEGDSLCFVKCLLGKRYVYACQFG